MYVSLVLEEVACLLSFLDGLLLVVCCNCHSKSEINLLQAEQVTPALLFAVRGALAGILNHTLQLTEYTTVD